MTRPSTVRRIQRDEQRESRDAEMLKALAAGYTTFEVARMFAVSVWTIRRVRGAHRVYAGAPA